MSFIDENGSISDPYKNFIHVSRYSRWLEEKGRRETWVETVDRYMTFMKNHLVKNYNYKEDDIKFTEVKEAILNHRVMPSMRAMMTAGPALERDHISSYNCSFIAVDSLRSFDEAMYILMNGTGVGFSVEQKYVSQLPVVAEELYPTNTTIMVEDSKLGWAKAYKELIGLLVTGQIPNWDMSKVRPAGARLKTFGGRASGPEPLNDLFKFTVEQFEVAKGRRLKSIEAHDLMCKIGEVVVVGGVRRSALISLSNLDDFEMAKAKSGQWWETEGQRALANNSAVYNMKPNTAQFLREWRNLYESKSGERGIYNMDSVRKHTDKFGRRDSSKIAGTNPSLIAGTKVWTDLGIVEIQYLEGSAFKVRNLDGNTSDATCWKSGEDKPIWEVSLGGGHKYYATEEHKWPVQRGGMWERVKTTELVAGDILKNTLHSSLYPDGEGTYDEGFLIGWNLGDGWQTDREYGLQIGFIVSDEDRANGSIDLKLTKILSEIGSTSELITKDEINVNNTALRSMFIKYGVNHKRDGLPCSVWDASISDDFRRGIIDGLLSSDGSVNVDDGRITLVQSNKKMIEDVSELLGFFGVQTHKGIKSTTGRKSFGWKDTYNKEDKVFTSYTLRIGGTENLLHFQSNFKLSRTDKQEKLNDLVSKVKTGGRISNETISVVSIVEAGTADVWDINVDDDSHAFRLAHAVTGNCGEILLRPNQFCNLTEVVIDSNDTEKSLKEKIRIATILGTWQSTLSNFKYIRKSWQSNTEEERLLGVSLTGIFGNPLTGVLHEGLDKMLDEFRELAVNENKKEADILGIEHSAAVTTVKPSGTVSQLTGVSSGIHPWYSEYYIRSVRADNKDPMTLFLKDFGVPNEPDVTKPDATTVFYFPIKAPVGSTVTKNISAIDHLEIWKVYRTHWTEHNPSVTINIKEDEWLDVGAWVYKNFDHIGGVSFLPSSDHSYKQAPYQEITKEEYDAALAAMPKRIPWESLPLYELEDGTSGSQELACSGALGCEVVDLTSVV